MAKTVIDWSKYTAEETIEILKEAPRVANVWRYSDTTQGYARHLMWDGKKGDAAWLTVARIWTSGDRKRWYASYAYDGDEYQRKALGPFEDRFEAAAAADNFLESKGWKLCK